MSVDRLPHIEPHPALALPAPHGDTSTDADVVDAAQFLAASGIPYQQLHRWTEHGYLRTTTGQPNPGSGYGRTWPAAEIEVARTLQRLVGAGLTLAAAHLVARGRTELAPGVQVLLDTTENR